MKRLAFRIWFLFRWSFARRRGDSIWNLDDEQPMKRIGLRNAWELSAGLW